MKTNDKFGRAVEIALVRVQPDACPRTNSHKWPICSHIPQACAIGTAIDSHLLSRRGGHRRAGFQPAFLTFQPSRRHGLYECPGALLKLTNGVPAFLTLPSRVAVHRPRVAGHGSRATALSNRDSKLLEISVSHSKQKIEIISNRDNFGHSPQALSHLPLVTSHWIFAHV